MTARHQIVGSAHRRGVAYLKLDGILGCFTAGIPVGMNSDQFCLRARTIRKRSARTQHDG